MPDARGQEETLVLARTIDARGAELRAKKPHSVRRTTYHVPRTTCHVARERLRARDNRALNLVWLVGFG
jgi:hypothetical protein